MRIAGIVSCREQWITGLELAFLTRGKKPYRLEDVSKKQLYASRPPALPTHGG
jgi:hypothetical protein